MGADSEAKPFDVIRRLVSPFCVSGESIDEVYQVSQDFLCFTSKRLILIDKQGENGRKITFVPYEAIAYYSIELAGSSPDANGDAADSMEANSEQFELYLKNKPEPITKSFSTATSDLIAELALTLSEYVLPKERPARVEVVNL